MVPSLSHAEVTENDVQDLISAPFTGEAGQVPPGNAECLSCQGQVFGLPVVAEGIQAALEVMLVPCACQKRWACGWVPTPGRDKGRGLSQPLQLPFEVGVIVPIL